MPIITYFIPCLSAFFAPLLVIWLLVRNQPSSIRALVWSAWGLVVFSAVSAISIITIQEWAAVMQLKSTPFIDHMEADAATTSYGLRPGANVPYRVLVEKYASLYSLDPTLVAAIIQQESGGNPTAVSSAGAIGLMQIMPITRADQCPGADLYDPEQNIACGTKHFRWTLDQVGGNVNNAVMAYHSGVTALKVNGPRPIDQQYLTAVTGYWQSAKADRVLVQANISAPPRVTASIFDVLGIGSDGDDSWGPIYQAGRITQGLHGQSYGHYAVDIAAGYQQPIFSPCNCCVSERFVDEYANPVLVLSNGRWQVTLLHGDYYGRVGDCYKVGEVVGTEASHGYSSGSHTHISVFDKALGQNVDPRTLGLTLKG